MFDRVSSLGSIVAMCSSRTTPCILLHVKQPFAPDASMLRYLGRNYIDIIISDCAPGAPFRSGSLAPGLRISHGIPRGMVSSDLSMGLCGALCSLLQKLGPKMSRDHSMDLSLAPARAASAKFSQAQSADGRGPIPHSHIPRIQTSPVPQMPKIPLLAVSFSQLSYGGPTRLRQRTRHRLRIRAPPGIWDDPVSYYTIAERAGSTYARHAVISNA